jgi:hypothetical protein
MGHTYRARKRSGGAKPRLHIHGSEVYVDDKKKFLHKNGQLYKIRNRESNNDYDPEEEWGFEKWQGSPAEAKNQQMYEEWIGEQIQERETQLQEQYENCMKQCQNVKDELESMNSAKLQTRINEIGLSIDRTLIDLLIERVLDPASDWKEKLDFLINIPHGFKGTENTNRGGDYFEALFQLLFAINASSRIQGHIHFMDINRSYTDLVEFEGEYKGKKTKNYLYGKTIRNSGGAEQGVSDITLRVCKKEDCKPYTIEPYVCGDVTSAGIKDIDGDEYYFFSIKGFYKEKSLKGKYDVEPISLQIKHITNLAEEKQKNSTICIGVRNKKDFEMRIKGARIGWLAEKVRNNVFGIEEVLEDLKQFRIRFFGKYFPTYSTQEQLDSISKEEIRKIVLEQEFPYEAPRKPALQLYFHQELISQAVVRRIHEVRGTGFKEPHYMCIGVLPRGGKSYIAGGIMEQYRQLLGKKQINILFLTSAVTETITQFKEDLIEHFSDFQTYSFLDIRKTKELKKDTSNFVFMSRQYVGAKSDEDKIEKGKEIKDELKKLMEKTSEMAFDLVFFDEAHIGAGSKEVQTLLQTMFTSFRSPVIFMTATYKKPVSILNIKPDDLFVWDLYDIQDIKQLPKYGYDAFLEFSQSDLIERYGDLVRGIFQRRKTLGQTPDDLAAPSLRFPEPVFISPTIQDALQKVVHEEGYDHTKAFAIQPIKGNETHKELLNDITRWREWKNLLVNGDSYSKDMRDYLTYESNDSIIQKDSAFKEIFDHSQLHSTTRPRNGTPFSVLMFLPMTTESVGALCRIWGSYMLENKWIRDHFVLLTLSPYSTDPREVPVGNQTGGMFEMVQIGGDTEKCVENGFCFRGSQGELKKMILDVERKALQKGKGLMLLSGDVAKMGISLPCVDVVCLLDKGQESDDIIQKMFRALTDNKGKDYGYIVDMNITRQISAMIEYDLQKDSQRKHKKVKFIEERLNELMELCDWGQNIYMSRHLGQIDYKDMMEKIRSHVLNNIMDKYLDDSIAVLDKEDTDVLYTSDIFSYGEELYNILKHTEFKGETPKIREALKFAQGSEFKDRKQTEGNKEKKGIEGEKEKEKQKTEEQVRQLILEKARNARKTFLNTLILLTQNIDSLISIADMLAIYKKAKAATIDSLPNSTEVGLSTISCRCTTEADCEAGGNVFERVFCQVFSYLKGIENPHENTLKVLELIETMFSTSTLQMKWMNYVDSFVRKMKHVPKQISLSPVRMEGGGVSSDRRYNHVLKVIDDHLIPDVKAKAERGEVFTPPDLVREMLFGLSKKALEKGITKIWGIDDAGTFVDADEKDRVGGLPTEVWRNPNLKWLDPANGIGNFPLIAFYKLDYELQHLKEWQNDDKRRKHIIENMLYMMELDKGNVAICRSLFKKIHPDAKPNLCCCDSLKITFDDINSKFGIHNFDVIMGNPPFNPPKTESGSSGNAIWQNFVMKSFTMLNTNGFLCFVHPPGWKKPTEDVFNPDKFNTGVFIGQIRQGQVWQVLKEHGNFSFICTNDQQDKTLRLEYLDFFPAVDYYVFQKTTKKSSCDTKNVFLGKVLLSTNVHLNYTLPYLPNLITSESMTIINNIYNKSELKPHFKVGFDPRGFKNRDKGTIKYLYDSNKNGPTYSFYKETIPNVSQSKVVINYGGGISGFYSDYINASEEIGILHMTMYHVVHSNVEGVRLKKLLNSDIIKFVFLITQYASGKMTKNEPYVANSISLPENDTVNYYKYYDIEKYTDYIETLLADYKEFKAPKRDPKTRKAKPTKGGRFNRTRRAQRRC